MWKWLNALTLQIPRASLFLGKTVAKVTFRATKASAALLIRALGKIARLFPAVRALLTATWNAVFATYNYIFKALKMAGAKTAAWAAKNAALIGNSRAVQAVTTRAAKAFASGRNVAETVSQIVAQAAVAGRSKIASGLQMVRGSRSFAVAAKVARTLSRTTFGRSLLALYRGIAWIGARLGAKLALIATPAGGIVTAVYLGFIAFNVKMNWKEICECVRNLGAIIDAHEGQGFFGAVAHMTGDEWWDWNENLGRLLVKIFI